MSDVGPIRTPQPPMTYELLVDGLVAPAGLAATCGHCDWSLVKPYPRAVRHGSDRAKGLAEDVARQCAQHQRDHLAAYVHGALRTAVGPSVEQAVKHLNDYGLVIVADPDWTPKAERAEVPADDAAA